MATTSVPLMSDIEGGDTEERSSDIKSDFSYHNNVAGAPALIRKGFLKKVNTYSLLKKGQFSEKIKFENTFMMTRCKLKILFDFRSMDY